MIISSGFKSMLMLEHLGCFFFHKIFLKIYFCFVCIFAKLIYFSINKKTGILVFTISLYIIFCSSDKFSRLFGKIPASTIFRIFLNILFLFCFSLFLIFKIFHKKAKFYKKRQNRQKNFRKIFTKNLYL
jgi:hypothetical protein